MDDDVKKALTIFRIVAPEFSDIPNEDTTEDGKTTYGIVTYIDLYKDLVSKKRFGKLYHKALAYVTAHKMKVSGLGQDEGLGSIAVQLRIGSVSEGETSVSYASGIAGSTDPDAEYKLTTYGNAYLELRRLVIIPILNAGEAEI